MVRRAPCRDEPRPFSWMPLAGKTCFGHGPTLRVSTHCLQDRRRTGTATGALGMCNWRAHSAHDGSRRLFERFALPNREQIPLRK